MILATLAALLLATAGALLALHFRDFKSIKRADTYLNDSDKAESFLFFTNNKK